MSVKNVTIAIFADINECETDPSACSQKCTNLKGGFQCSCVEVGLVLVQLLYCPHQYIRTMDNDRPNFSHYSVYVIIDIVFTISSHLYCVAFSELHPAKRQHGRQTNVQSWSGEIRQRFDETFVSSYLFYYAFYWQFIFKKLNLGFRKYCLHFRYCTWYRKVPINIV